MEKQITVAQLIRQLQALGIEAQDLPVVRRDTDWGYVQIRRGAQIVKIEPVALDDSYGWTVDEDDPGIKAVILK